MSIYSDIGLKPVARRVAHLPASNSKKQGQILYRKLTL